MNKKIILVAVLIILGAGLYSYFFIFSPTFVEKPFMEKPMPPNADEPVSTQHINWIINELGAYRLHNDPTTGEPPVLELKVTDSEEVFTITTENNVPASTEGAAQNPDIRITATRVVVIKLLTTEDVNKEIIELYNEGNVGIELLKGQATLALKGYKGIYDELSG